MKVFFSYILFSGVISVVIGQFPQCKNVEPCACFENTGQISCIGTVKDKLTLTENNLKSIASNLQGGWDLLQIHMTTIEYLPLNLFTTNKFEKIVIEGNDNLKGINNNTTVVTTASSVTSTTKNSAYYEEMFIEDNALLVNISDDISLVDQTKSFTKKVIIRNNKLLDIANFEFLNNFKDSLTNLELDGNKIQLINANSFSNFKNLNLIFLDKQKGENMVIKADAFNKLENLKELRLDGNHFKTIDKHAIDLSETKIPRDDELLIFLNNSFLDDTASKTEIIKFSTAEFIGNLMVFLGGNPFTVIDDKLIGKIADKGFVFIGHKSLTCDCADVTSIAKALKDKSSHIQNINIKQPCIKDKQKSTTVDIINC